ncbi:hypothetical protein PI125_g9378 [Phytophthora idaei]|nr:hypothetical protein PI125_g9378 [Phytophthora idaei]
MEACLDLLDMHDIADWPSSTGSSVCQELSSSANAFAHAM